MTQEAKQEWINDLDPSKSLKNMALDAFKDDVSFLDNIAYYTPELLPYVSNFLAKIESKDLYEIIHGGVYVGMHFADIITRSENIEDLNKISKQVGDFSLEQLKSMTRDCESWDDTSFIQRIIDAAKNINYSNAFKAIFSNSKDKSEIYSILKTTEPKLNYNEILDLALTNELVKLKGCCEHLLLFQPFYHIRSMSKEFAHPKASEILDFPETVTTLLSLSKTSEKQEENNHETHVNKKPKC